MKQRQLICLLLAMMFLVGLAGCARADGSYERHMEAVMQMEQTDGNSPIGGIRTGVLRAGAQLAWGAAFECTDDGFYFCDQNLPCQYDEGDDGTLDDTRLGAFVLFCQHGSDTIIKLCGRPDCTHQGVGCNAFFEHGIGGIFYYDEHLYVAEDLPNRNNTLALYRIDLNGGNRIKVADFSFVKNGYSGYQGCYGAFGVFMFDATYIDSDTGNEYVHRYYIKLDGSMREFERSEYPDARVNQELMCASPYMNENGELINRVTKVDIRNDTEDEVFECPWAGPAYWGAEAGYELIDNALVKVNYADGSQEILFDTGLEGNFTPRFMPDCIILIETTDFSQEEPSNPSYYFYSWEGDYLGELVIDFPHEAMVEAMIGGETKDRILLSTAITAIPEYYIEKSDFGSGKIELHRFQYPDFTEKQLETIFGARS